LDLVPVNQVGNVEELDMEMMYVCFPELILPFSCNHIELVLSQQTMLLPLTSKPWASMKSFDQRIFDTT
jgi:hypothetical protein